MTTDTVPLHPRQATPYGTLDCRRCRDGCCLVAVYSQLEPFAGWLASLLPLENGSHLEAAVQFFIYDTPKVLMLLTLVVFAMGVVRSFFSPERTQALLAGRREGVGNIAAATLVAA